MTTKKTEHLALTRSEIGSTLALIANGPNEAGEAPNVSWFNDADLGDLVREELVTTKPHPTDPDQPAQVELTAKGRDELAEIQNPKAK